MLIKIFTLEFSLSLGKFDDSEVINFLINKNLIGTKDYLVEKNGEPYLILVLTYSVSDKDIKLSPNKEEQKGGARTKDESWKELITKENEGLFNILRNWRYEMSKKEGVPSYIVFTNKQLAEITSKAPESLNQLSQIDGIGPAKVQKYGVNVLEILTKSKKVESHA